MSVRRVMGTETEYAVSAPEQGRYNPVQLSFDVVGAASDASRSHIRWDYRQEDPILNAANPYDYKFNSMNVWGPLMGRKFYAGLRFNLY